MKIQMTNRNQFFVGIPSPLIKALGWNKADVVIFEIMGKDKIKMEKVKS